MSNIEPDAFCWYRSDTRLGLMYLGVQTSEAEQANLQGPHSIFQKAALLANTEVMVQAIELWQEIDLDLVPCEPPENTSLHLSLRLNNSGDSANNGSAITAVEPAQSEADSAKLAPAEPEVAEPETAEPETAEPETAEPETAEPETAEPETTEPETTEPETTEPETTEPETTDHPAGTPNPETSADSENADFSSESVNTDNSEAESTDAGEQISTTESQNQSSSHAYDGQPHIALVFDYATLVKLKSLSHELQSVLSVSSSNIDLRVQLDQLSVTAEEMAMIKAGAVMVMPAAFEPEWGVVAVSTSPDVPLRFGGSVKQADQSLQVQFAIHEAAPGNTHDSTDETSNDSLTVWCEQLCSVPVKELLGTDNNTQSAKLHLLDARALSIVQGDSTIAHGSLLPYGRGSVVAVSERVMD